MSGLYGKPNSGDQLETLINVLMTGGNYYGCAGNLGGFTVEEYIYMDR
jgi:hypothetical protein